MTLAQKLKDLRKEFVNDMTTKMVNEFTVDLFDPMDKGGNLNETRKKWKICIWKHFEKHDGPILSSRRRLYFI